MAGPSGLAWEAQTLPQVLRVPFCRVAPAAWGAGALLAALSFPPRPPPCPPSWFGYQQCKVTSERRQGPRGILPSVPWARTPLTYRLVCPGKQGEVTGMALYLLSDAGAKSLSLCRISPSLRRGSGGAPP